MQMQLGLAFCGPKFTMMRAYVTVCVLGMREISLCIMTKIEFVPFCPVFRLHCAIPPKIFPKSSLPHFSCGGVMHQPFVTADVSPVLGCTIDIATCSKSMHVGVDVGLSLFGVKMSGELAQTHSVRKFIPSWLTMLLLRNPLLIGMNQTFGSCVLSLCFIGARVHGEPHGGTAVIGTWGEIGTWCHCAVLVIKGMLPGMLFCIHCGCVRFVNLRARCIAELGANMTGGAFVIQARFGRWGGWAFALCSRSSVTLCLGGGTYGTIWRFPCGRIHSWPELVRHHLGSWSWPDDFFSWPEWVHMFAFKWHLF